MKYSKAKTMIWDNFYKEISKARKKSSKFSTKGKIFASNAGEGCEKMLHYYYIGEMPVEENPWPGKEAKIGDAIHEEIQKDLEKKFGDKVSVEDFYPIEIGDVRVNCKIDTILYSFKEPKILEYKTVKDTEGKKPRMKDIYQVQLYMGATDVKSAVLSYFKRSNGMHINSFEIDFDPEIFQEIRDKYLRVQKGEDLEIDTSSCKFCPFQHICEDYSGK